MTVAVDNRMALEWHGHYLLIGYYLSHQDEPILSRLRAFVSGQSLTGNQKLAPAAKAGSISHCSLAVMPVKTGIQVCSRYAHEKSLDSRFRGNDETRTATF